MPVDEHLVDRVRRILARCRGITEQRMFGGVAFLIDGHMCCGVVHSDLMLRLGAEGAADALDQDHTRPMDFTGRAMSTMVYVGPAGVANAADLRRWVTRAIEFASTLPPKTRR